MPSPSCPPPSPPSPSPFHASAPSTAASTSTSHWPQPPRSPKRARAASTAIDTAAADAARAETMLVPAALSASAGPSGRVSAGSTRARARAPRSVGQADWATSPCRSPVDGAWAKAQRRREMSVPLASTRHASSSIRPDHNIDTMHQDKLTIQLSQTLSHFSLSRTPPTLQPPTSPSPPYATSTPRRLLDPARPFPTHDLVHPATAPLPSLPAFLGSPFNTRSRGAYQYQASPTLHKLGHPDATDDWAGPTEWIDDTPKDVALAEAEFSDCAPSSRRRRDTSGSSSSNDDLYSGASSASLPSLGRRSSDGRPSAIAIWSADADELELGTPSRQLFTAPLPSTSSFGEDQDAVTFSSLGKGPAPGGPRTFDRTSSQATVMPSPRHSPFANLLPRLRRRSPRYEAHEDTDTEDAGATTWGSPRPRPGHDRVPHVRGSPRHDDVGNESIEHIGLGLGIGIGIIRSDSILSSHAAGRVSPPMPATRHSTSTLSPSASPRLSQDEGHAPIPKLRRTTSSNATVQQSPAPLRPMLRRGLTDSLLPMFDTPPHLPTFGDAKPSPAAFASTGLIKKKRSKISVPIFGAGVIGKARSWTTLGQAECEVAAHVMEQLASPISPLISLNPIGPMSPLSPLKMDVAKEPKARGLRRKGSTMFGAGLGTDADKGRPSSPATPTKPDVPSLRIGVHTPSPSHATAYPFAPSTLTPTHATSPASMPRVRELAGGLGRGPLVRTSNPMLSAAYQADRRVPERSGGVAVGGAGLVGGNRLERDFQIVRALGQGEFSRVWEVRDKKESRVWAVKAGKPYTGYKNRLRQLEEASILRQLSLSPHPHVVTYVDSWEHASRLHIQLELLSCGDLSRFLDALSDAGGLGEARVWKVLVELLSALRHVHAHGYVHLDLKPSNVLITASGSLKLADFGMSTLLAPAELDVGCATGGGLSPALPQSGPDGGFVWAASASVEKSPIVDREFEGDREYLCPEALGERPPGAPADVFSLGILLLEAALNVVLPPNGDGWVKLRNDDFSDLDEHFVARRTGAGGAGSPGGAVDAGDARSDGLPVLSDTLVRVIRDMMRSDPDARATLDTVAADPVVCRVKAAMRAGTGEGGGMRAGPALVDEPAAFLEWALGQGT